MVVSFVKNFNKKLNQKAVMKGWIYMKYYFLSRWISYDTFYVSLNTRLHSFWILDTVQCIYWKFQIKILADKMRNTSTILGKMGFLQWDTNTEFSWGFGNYVGTETIEGGQFDRNMTLWFCYHLGHLSVMMSRPLIKIRIQWVTLTELGGIKN